MIFALLVIVLVLGVIWLGASVRIIKQFERGVVFRFGCVRPAVRGPGIILLTPIADRLQKINMQIITMPVPAQDGITRDNVTVPATPSTGPFPTDPRSRCGRRVRPADPSP